MATRGKRAPKVKESPAAAAEPAPGNGVLGVALVGAGDIGTARAEAIAKTHALKLVVVADLRSDAAHELAQRFGAAATTDWEGALARDDVSLVVVSTPPPAHAEVAHRAFAAGKHVLCEKPLAHRLEDAAAMCAEAERRGVVLSTGFNHRRFEAVDFARKLIESGKIGQVKGVKAYAGHPGGKEFAHSWVHETSVTGGGSLVDIGIHILDLVRYLGGEFESAAGFTAHLIWPFEAEDNAFALFRALDGRVASVHASWTEWRGARFRIEVIATQGYVEASYPPMRVEWGVVDAPGEKARKHVELFTAVQMREQLRGARSTIVSSFAEELALLAETIRTGAPGPATGGDGLAAIRMAHAVYRSSREGREVGYKT